MLNWLFNKFGYYILNSEEYKSYQLASQAVDDMLFMFDESEVENRGLRTSVATFQRRHEQDNIILSSLMALTGDEEITLKKALVDEIFNKGLLTIYNYDKDGNIVCTTKIAEKVLNQEEYDICEDCGGICGADCNIED